MSTSPLRAETPARSLPVVYKCAECGERLLQRRCPDCNLFTRRLGPGGRCLHCDELVTVDELADLNDSA